MSQEFQRGDKVCWRALNRIQSGVVERIRPPQYLIRLANGKCIVAHETSLNKSGTK